MISKVPVRIGEPARCPSTWPGWTAHAGPSRSVRNSTTLSKLRDRTAPETLVCRCGDARRLSGHVYPDDTNGSEGTSGVVYALPPL